MPASRSVIRRYTAATCILEIFGRGSLLSRAQRHPSLKQFQFELRWYEPKQPEVELGTIGGERSQLESLHETVTSYIQEFLRQSPTSMPLLSAAPQAQATSSPQLQIQPRGLLAHELFVGSLATEDSGQVIPLTALQLFDLATVLEECHAEMATFPSSHRSRRLSLWAGTAAALLLAVGLTTAALRWFNQLDTESDSATSVAQQESRSTNEKMPIEIAPVPSPPSRSPSPPPSPKPSSPLSSAERLPPPPPVDTPPSPHRPNLSQATPLPTGNLPSPPPEIAPTSPPLVAQRESNANKSNTQPSSPTPSPKTPAPRQEAAPPSPLQTLQTENAPPSSPSPTLPNLPPLPPKSASKETPSIASSPGTNPSTSLQPDEAPDQPAAKSNNLPQVAEVRQYFQQGWEPPENLSRLLEYNLILNQDGSIQRIIPLGEVSKTYLDRTEIPLIGEPFVSSIDKAKGNPKIRVILNPDGSVNTFLESIN